MADQRLKFTDFRGGESDDDDVGASNSASTVLRANIRKSPGLVTLMPKPASEWRASTVAASTASAGTGFTDAARVSNGDVYFCCTGFVLKRAASANGTPATYAVLTLTVAALTSAGYTVIDPNSHSFTQAQYVDYRQDLNTLFFYGPFDITEFNLTTNTWTIDKYNAITEIDQSANTGGNYPVPTAISEAQKFTFSLKSEPLFQVKYNITAIGTTGLFTVSVHDEANSLIASVNTSIGAPGILTASFLTTRIKVNTNYHVHITSTGTGATVRSTAANDLPNAAISVSGSRLVNVDHPTYQYGAKTYICNGRYIAEWEILDTSVGATAGFVASRIILPSNYKSIGVAEYSEYLAFGCEITESTDTNDTLNRNGAIVFWNTTSQLIDWVLPVPEGAPNGLISYRGGLRWEANGVMQKWSGGDIEIDYEFPGTSDFAVSDSHHLIESHAKVAPRGMTVHDNILLCGWPLATTNANARIGVYSFGHRKSQMPEATSYDYTMSTGSTTPHFKSTSTWIPRTGITMVKSLGNNLFICWKDVVSPSDSSLDVGIDIVNNNVSKAAASGSWESLWFDNDDPDVKKTSKAIKATFKYPLPAGCTVMPKIRYDGSDTWVYAEAAAGEGDRDVVLMPNGADHHQWYQAMVGFDMTSSSGNYPYVRSEVFKFDDNRQNTKNTEEPYDAGA